MSSPFDSLPSTPAFERRNKMGLQSPQSNWTLDGNLTSNDLFWTKSHELNAVSAFDALDLNDVLAADAGTSSGSSTYSEADGLSAFGLHHLPAWSTMAMARKAQGKDLSSGARAAGSISRGVSPSAGISPSGLSEEGNAAAGGSNSFGGAMDDIWFMSSPGSLQEPSTSSSNGLQRKKKMHFKPNFPSSRFVDANDCGADREPDTAVASTSTSRGLKPAKSMSQIPRRVSSHYTARLEDLLSEMGWPRQESESHAGVEEDADTTIQASSSYGAGGSSHHRAPLQQSQSYAGFQDNHSSPFASAAHLSSSQSSMGAIASGVPAASSALFQRRAVNRERGMPSPAPVTIPRRSQEFDGPKTDDGIIPVHFDNRTHSPAHLYPQSATFTTSDGSFSSSLPAQMMHSQSLDAQHYARSRAGGQQQAASSSRGMGMSQANEQPQRSTGPERSANAGYPMFFYGAVGGNQRTSVGSSTSAYSGGSGNVDSVQTNTVPLPFGVSPSSNGARSLTASTMSNNTELLTPITPFTNMPFSNVGSGPWSVVQPFDMRPSTGNGEGNDGSFSFAQLPTKPGSSDPTAPHFTTNALGLYQDPALLNSSGPNFSPNAVIDPAAYAHLLSAGLLNPADLSAATKFNRARASTAMAALEMPRSGPRVMRSQPNMRMTPPATPLREPPLPFSTHATPQKSPRKIASNRRLNAQTPEAAPTPSFGPAPMAMHSPHSPLKRARSGLPIAGPGAGFGGGGGAFEFINYGIEDADELCSGVAPSGSYKIPLKGFGAASGGEDDDDDIDGGDSDDARSPPDDLARSPRRGRRGTKSTSNRSGPRWEDPPLPPLPGYNDGSSSSRSNNDVPLPPSSPAMQAGGRQIKRRKSDASMMLAGRHKSASTANLRK